MKAQINFGDEEELKMILKTVNDVDRLSAAIKALFEPVEPQENLYDYISNNEFSAYGSPFFKIISNSGEDWLDMPFVAAERPNEKYTQQDIVRIKNGEDIRFSVRPIEALKGSVDFEVLETLEQWAKKHYLIINKLPFKFRELHKNGNEVTFWFTSNHTIKDVGFTPKELASVNEGYYKGELGFIYWKPLEILEQVNEQSLDEWVNSVELKRLVAIDSKWFKLSRGTLENTTHLFYGEFNPICYTKPELIEIKENRNVNVIWRSINSEE